MPCSLARLATSRSTNAGIASQIAAPTATRSAAPAPASTRISREVLTLSYATPSSSQFPSPARTPHAELSHTGRRQEARRRAPRADADRTTACRAGGVGRGGAGRSLRERRIHLRQAPPARDRSPHPLHQQAPRRSRRRENVGGGERRGALRRAG